MTVDTPSLSFSLLPSPFLSLSFLSVALPLPLCLSRRLSLTVCPLPPPLFVPSPVSLSFSSRLSLFTSLSLSHSVSVSLSLYPSLFSFFLLSFFLLSVSFFSASLPLPTSSLPLPTSSPLPVRPHSLPPPSFRRVTSRTSVAPSSLDLPLSFVPRTSPSPLSFVSRETSFVHLLFLGQGPRTLPPSSRRRRPRLDRVRPPPPSPFPCRPRSPDENPHPRTPDLARRSSVSGSEVRAGPRGPARRPPGAEAGAGTPGRSAPAGASGRLQVVPGAPPATRETAGRLLHLDALARAEDPDVQEVHLRGVVFQERGLHEAVVQVDGPSPGPDSRRPTGSGAQRAREERWKSQRGWWRAGGSGQV